jgi:hypothetical protein
MGQAQTAVVCVTANTRHVSAPTSRGGFGARLVKLCQEVVLPAKAGSHLSAVSAAGQWIPAFAGRTVLGLNLKQSVWRRFILAPMPLEGESLSPARSGVGPKGRVGGAVSRKRPPPLRLCAVVVQSAIAVLLAGCGGATLDLSGYPDKAHERLYSEGRLGGAAGLADVDLRRAWRAVLDRAP